MDALSSFLENPWGSLLAYWNTVPSHIRLIVSFLITRTISGMIRRAVTPKPDPASAKKGAVIEVGDLPAFEAEVNASKANDRLMVVDFTASWCEPCKRVAPQYAALSLKYGDVSFVKVDVNKAKDVASRANVRCMPTFQFFKDGEKVDTMEGADAAKIEKILRTLGAEERCTPDPDDAPKDDAAKKTE
jgi:thioredoxin